MKYHQPERDYFPSRIQAAGEEADLHGQIARPDNKQLREAEIGPQHNEGEHQLAMVMNYLRLQHRSQGLIWQQNAPRNDHHAHCREALSYDEDESEDRRIPGQSGGLDPVES